MKTYTPGPWTVARVNRATFNVRAGEDSICAIYSHIGSPALMDRANEGAANARLIAAAPDLLAALKALLAHIDRINPPTGPYWSGADDQEAARELIAKVEGE